MAAAGCGAGLALGGQRHHHGGDAGNGAHGGLGLGPDGFPGPRLGGIDVDREEHLAVGRADRTQHIGIGERDPAGRLDPGEAVENLLLRHAQSASPEQSMIRKSVERFSDQIMLKA